MAKKRPAQSSIQDHLPLRPVEFVTLAVLKDGPAHGYALAGEIEERTGGRLRVRPGDLYRVLYRLTNRGFIEETRGSAGDAAGPPRAYYRITKLGRTVVRAEARMIAKVAAGVMGPETQPR